MIFKKLQAVAAVWLLLSLSASQGSRAQTKRDEAWDILKSNINEKSAEKSSVAIRVLELLPGDPQALELAQKAATDERPDVRSAAATTLGQLHGKSTVAILHKLLSDPEPSVALAAASALMPTKDPEAFEVYYEILTGERKTGKGMIAEQMKTLKDPKKLAALGVEGGVGFFPFAALGLVAFQTLRVDDVSPVRAAAAKMLTNDPDPESGQALVNATTDKSWLIKTAALEAIAKRGDPQLLDGILPALTDDNTAVRCTAAAAVIRLSTLAEAKGAPEKKVGSISK